MSPFSGDRQSLQVRDHRNNISFPSLFPLHLITLRRSTRGVLCSDSRVNLIWIMIDVLFVNDALHSQALVSFPVKEVI